MDVTVSEEIASVPTLVRKIQVIFRGNFVNT